jgi:transcriptional regulator with XRE-family HTH domain
VPSGDPRLRHPGLESEQVLDWLRDYQPDASIIVVTAYPSVDSAVNCLRTQQTFDYLPKPFQPGHLQKVVTRCLEGKGLLRLSEAALRETLGATIRERRKKMGLTLQQMAHRTNVSLGYLSQIELGKNSASIETLYRICLGLGIKLSDLFRKCSRIDLNGSSFRARRRQTGNKAATRPTVRAVPFDVFVRANNEGQGGKAKSRERSRRLFKSPRGQGPLQRGHTGRPGLDGPTALCSTVLSCESPGPHPPRPRLPIAGNRHPARAGRGRDVRLPRRHRRQPTGRLRVVENSRPPGDRPFSPLRRNRALAAGLRQVGLARPSAARATAAAELDRSVAAAFAMPNACPASRSGDVRRGMSTASIAARAWSFSEIALTGRRSSSSGQSPRLERSAIRAERLNQRSTSPGRAVALVRMRSGWIVRDREAMPISRDHCARRR